MRWLTNAETERLLRIETPTVFLMKMSEIASRLNGISTPFFGLSWTPATADVQVAKGVITYLEGRRLPYDGHEIPPYSEAIRRIDQSVREIRAFLTQTLVAGGIGPEMDQTLRLMRRACMDFLDALERWQDFATNPDKSTVGLDEASEDREAHARLFRQTMYKLMIELGDAHGIDTDWTRQFQGRSR
jgi:hypothetical protein